MKARSGSILPRIPALVAAGDTTSCRREAALTAEISAMPMAFGTAHNLIERASIGEGSKLLVAFSGQPLGYAVIRLATIRGIEVVGQCPSEATPLVRAAGARPFETYDCSELRNFNAIIDLVPAGDRHAICARLVAGGRYVVTGALTDLPVAGERRQVFLNEVTRYDRPHRPRELFAGLVTVIETSHLRIVPQQLLKDAEND